MAKGLNPQFHEGQKINLFGISATVVSVEPYSDYAWNVNLSAVNGGGAAEVFTIIVPTDYNTTDGVYVWEPDHVCVMRETPDGLGCPSCLYH